MNEQIMRYSVTILLLSLFAFSSFAQIKIEPQNLLLPSGETAVFKAKNNAANVQYQWLKNGAPITGATESVLTYNNVQLLDDSTQFQLVIKDETNTVTSELALLRVTANNRPYPNIRLLSNTEEYAAGDTIYFKGDITDIEEGILPASAFTWSVELHQNNELFSVTTPTSGIVDGYFVIPRDGKLSEDAWYRIVLVGKDSEGLSQRTFYDVFPEKAQFQLITDPEGLNLRVEGEVQKSPHVITTIKGRQWNIAAPKLQVKDRRLLLFTEWSDGYTEANYPLYADENFLLYAIYEEIGLDNGTGLLARYFENEEQEEPSRSQVEEIFITADTAKNYAVTEWIGEIKAIVSDWHEFTVGSDGNVRLRVDNQLIIDNWDSEEKDKKPSKVKLERGKRYPIHLEVKNAETLSLFWSTPDLTRSPVPKNQLFPASDGENDLNLIYNYNRQEGIIHLELSKLNAQQEQINVRILGTQGRTFFQQQFPMGKGLKTMDLDMRFYLPGVYFLEVRGKEFKKVVKVPR